ncbi:MAG: hypothetical protein JW814_06885 [Candidatus Krumholzibacteriota bacterium]|nr:hypothetical protein [Candidatus Krumholzibacteriota bacterium]
MNIAKVFSPGLLFIFVLISFSAASAEVMTEHFETDAEMLEYLSDTMFVAEGRIGDRGGYATFELDIGNDTGAPAQTAQYDWISGQPEPFTVSYDAVTRQVAFSLGGTTLYYTTEYFDFDQIFVRTRATNAETSILIDDIVVDGEAISDQSYADGNDGLDILWIIGANLNDGFLLSGTATLSWTGTAPTNSRLAFQVKVGKLALIDTEEASWGGIKSVVRQP